MSYDIDRHRLLTLQDKPFHLLLYLIEDEHPNVHELIRNSIVEFVDTSTGYSSRAKFYITVSAEIYKKFQNNLRFYGEIFSEKIHEITQIEVTGIEFRIDIEKFQITGNRLISILTPWEEINQLQDKLIDSFKHSSDSADFQNLGNTARTIMNKLSLQVFNPGEHRHHDPKANLSDGMYKNQLTAFIQTKLAGRERKEFRKLAEVSIDVVHSSVDFMNTATHKLDAEKHIAEVCIISTISAISIIKMVNEL